MWHKMRRSEIAAARQGILEAAQPSLMRLLGPGSGGLVVPGSGLNASATPVPIKPGKIAVLSQSTTIIAAGRNAGRNKPLVAIHCGRLAAVDATDGPLRAEDVFQAALRRAGWVSVDTLGALFEAVEAIARVRPQRGDSLAILGNGHGPGRIAAETLLRAGGRLGDLSPATLRHFEKRLQTRSHLSNPLALPPGMRADGWAAALSAMLADSRTDTVLTVCPPSPFVASDEVATALCAVSRQSQHKVLTAWIGGGAMLQAQRIAAAHGVLSHDSPERAIAVFLGVLNCRRNRDLLIQMPPSLAADFPPDSEAARSVVGEALTAAGETLSARHTRRLLQAHGIVVADTPAAPSIDAALLAAEQIGYPVDLALLLANGAVFDETAGGLPSPAEIRIAARDLRRRLRARHPARRVTGYRLRPNAARSGPRRCASASPAMPSSARSSSSPAARPATRARAAASSPCRRSS
ncbi:acetate--CoA ligase family protein [Accumulibacter sp.]|uniref:acetate--CoA ligase family protein n=1 Tax=Accumulibacter sp. TaxID=2053492 RepID=UPI002C34ADE6|nr:acetate--CoA ligase family protein [Accumulibacter sp.]HNB68709.1 acetate--CoA ligase family protein [Accumulibacter sp.]